MEEGLETQYYSTLSFHKVVKMSLKAPPNSSHILYVLHDTTMRKNSEIKNKGDSAFHNQVPELSRDLEIGFTNFLKS